MSADRSVAERIGALKEIFSNRDGEASAIVAGAFQDRSPAVRGEAVLAVEEHRLTQLLPLVQERLHDRSAEVRHDAAQCIGVLLKDSRTPQFGLKALLKDSDSVVRAQAIESLGLVGDTSAIPKIVPLLLDSEPFVRSYAASTIGEFGDRSYAKRLRQSLKCEKNELAMVGLLTGLFMLGERIVFQRILELLSSSDYHVRCSVANALEILALSKEEARLAIDALAEARRRPIAAADRSTANRVLKKLKYRNH